VAYGGTFGPDLEEILAATKLSYESFIAVHTSKEYLCYMLGFTPGFVYLGDVDDRIALPRLKSPKSRIAPGSVGIAGKQTGIYGVESPGGWRIIGKTPIKMFDPRRSPPIAIKPGDKVRFYPVTVEQYKQMEGVYLTDLSTSQAPQSRILEERDTGHWECLWQVPWISSLPLMPILWWETDLTKL